MSPPRRPPSGRRVRLDRCAFAFVAALVVATGCDQEKTPLQNVEQERDARPPNPDVGGPPDAARSDAGAADAGVSDGARPDADAPLDGSPDADAASLPDALIPDAAPPLCEPGAAFVCSRNVGECREGLRLCTPEGQLTPCDGIGPGPEICDGLDTDCDGRVDELPGGCDCLVGNREPCGSGVGQCRVGYRICNRQGRFGLCYEEVLGVGEVANGRDDDCDGLIDEDTR